MLITNQSSATEVNRMTAMAKFENRIKKYKTDEHCITFRPLELRELCTFIQRETQEQKYI